MQVKLLVRTHHNLSLVGCFCWLKLLGPWSKVDLLVAEAVLSALVQLHHLGWGLLTAHQAINTGPEQSTKHAMLMCVVAVVYGGADLCVVMVLCVCSIFSSTA